MGDEPPRFAPLPGVGTEVSKWIAQIICYSRRSLGFQAPLPPAWSPRSPSLPSPGSAGPWGCPGMASVSNRDEQRRPYSRIQSLLAALGRTGGLFTREAGRTEAVPWPWSRSDRIAAGHLPSHSESWERS